MERRGPETEKEELDTHCGNKIPEDEVLKRRLKRVLQESWGSLKVQGGRGERGATELRSAGKDGQEREVHASLPKQSVSSTRKTCSSKRQGGFRKTWCPQQEVR